MLKIIYSLPGGGKTTYIYENLRVAAEESKTHATAPKQMSLIGLNELRDLTRPVMIVPEQFHFETEHILYKKLGAALIGNVEITSFTKMSSEINSLYGKAKPYAERTIREITMFRVLAKLGKEKGLDFYTVFGRKKNGLFSSGIIQDTAMQILRHIEGFQKEGILPTKLEETYNDLFTDNYITKTPDTENAFQKHNVRLWRRMSDLIKIYKAYNIELNIEYSDRLDDTVKAAELALFNGYFKNREIFLDGFDGFSGSQFKLIEVMMSECKSMTVSLLSDKIISEKIVYKTSSSLYERLAAKAREANKKIKGINLNNYETYKKTERCPVVFPPFIAPDVYRECEYVAAKIREIVTKEKYSFNEIAILGGQDMLYKNALNSALQAYGVSAFADIPTPVIEKPFVRFLITVLEAATFKPEKLLLYIKSGFVRIRHTSKINTESRLLGINKRNLILKEFGNVKEQNEKAVIKSTRLSKKDISRLEEAAKKWRLSGKDWKSKFPEGDRLLRQLESLRKEIINPLMEFSDKIKSTTGDKITEALADFLINRLEIQRTILSIVNKRTDVFKKGFSIDRSMNDEYRQLWETIISVLEAMYDAMIGYPINAEDYTSILISVLSKTDIARPPQVLDAVTVGDVERSRTDGIKIAFIIGVNQGVFPKSLKSEGEFNSDEINELLRAGIEIYENRAERYYRERFVVNKALHTPSERLYLSAPLSGLSWEPLELSPLLNGTEDEIYNIKIPANHLTPNDFPVSFWASTNEAAKNVLACNMNNFEIKNALSEVLLKNTNKNIPNKMESKNVKKEDINNSSYKSIINLCFESHNKLYNSDSIHLHKIDSSTAGILLKTNSLSPSGIELLNSCGFKYFCEKGLKIRSFETENNIELNSLQRGNLIHYCLYRALSGGDVNQKGFTRLKPAQLANLAHNFINEFIEKELLSGYARTKRQNDILYDFKPRIVRMLGALQLELSVSRFKPHALEESFSYNLSGLQITGKTDRYDTFINGSDTYIKVVDYKTGKNIFSYPALYYGLGMQSLIYLFGVLEKHPEWIPSGAYYYSENIGYKTETTLPNSEILLTTEKDGIRSWVESHKHAGIQFFENRESEDSNDVDKIENVIKNAAGYPDSRKSLIERNFIEREDYNRLKDFTGELLNDKLNVLYNGEIWALPVKNGKKKPCDYCEYNGFCGNNGTFSIEVKKDSVNKIFDKQIND